MTAPPVTLIVVDIAWIVGSSVVVGAWAPRWPASWVDRDRFPVCRWLGETTAHYRAIGVRAFAHRLPEGGASFGGQSKAYMRGLTVEDLRAHACEIRRAEWVHWWSIACSLVLFWFNPWRLAAAFVLVVTLGNLPCLLVLRHNRLRITTAIERRDVTA